jgi:hypothetical protein
VKLESFVFNAIPEPKRNLTVPEAITLFERAREVHDMPSLIKDDDAVPETEYGSARIALDRLYQKYTLYFSKWVRRLAEDRVRGDTSQFLFGEGSSRAPQEKAAEAEASRFRHHRRGRGLHQVIGLNGSDDPEDPVRPFPRSLSSRFLITYSQDFFTRDVEFRFPSGTPNLARCRLDSQCEVPLLFSTHWARENDKLSQVSRDFKDPGMMSVSGHEIKVDGVLRNMVFNLRGSTVTYRRDVFVCGDLDGWADMVAGTKYSGAIRGVVFEGEEDVCRDFQLEEGEKGYDPFPSYLSHLVISCLKVGTDDEKNRREDPKTKAPAGSRSRV